MSEIERDDDAFGWVKADSVGPDPWGKSIDVFVDPDPTKRRHNKTSYLRKIRRNGWHLIDQCGREVDELGTPLK